MEQHTNSHGNNDDGRDDDAGTYGHDGVCYNDDVYGPPILQGVAHHFPERENMPVIGRLWLQKQC